MRRMCLVVVFILKCVECVSGEDQNCASRFELQKLNQEMNRLKMDMEQRMAKLQYENRELNRRLVDIESKGRLKSHLQKCPAKQRKRRLLMDNSPVAFLASLNAFAKEEHLGVNQNIIFDTVTTNLGGAFNVNHSIFIVPQSGLYLISATVLSWLDSEVRACIMVNGQRTVSLFGHGSGGRHEQGTQVAVLELKLGDIVSVENIDLSDITIWGDRYTSFTGVLLYSME